MKVSNIIPYFNEELKGITDAREITSWAYLVIKYILGLNRSDTIIYSNTVLSIKDSDSMKQIIKELKKNKPIQYILGETEFCGLKFKVNKYTLIPRSETEELVEWILQEEFSSALDIGTGSGCIAIALAKQTNAFITAIDISEDALNVAKQNSRINRVEINFLYQDILKTSILPKVDVIVSNPPYVLESEKQYMKEDVLQFEPPLALFPPSEDPLLFFKIIGNLAAKSLNRGGKLFFEINEQYGSEILKILAKIGFVDIALKKDINDKDRMIKAIRK